VSSDRSTQARLVPAIAASAISGNARRSRPANIGWRIDVRSAKRRLAMWAPGVGRATMAGVTRLRVIRTAASLQLTNSANSERQEVINGSVYLRIETRLPSTAFTSGRMEIVSAYGSRFWLLERSPHGTKVRRGTAI
jgi:hypothetical protein